MAPARERDQVHATRRSIDLVASLKGTRPCSPSGQRPGIDPEFLPDIFDRFTQADSSPTRAAGGLGVGLALVRELVELHGGEIRGAQSARGRRRGLHGAVSAAAGRAARAGSSPPAVEWMARPRAAAARRPARAGARSRSSRAASCCARCCSSAAPTVRTAASVADALESLEAWRPDVLVSDARRRITMRIRCTGRIQSLDADRGGRIPALALTARRTRRHALGRLLADVQRDLPKPVEPAVLTAEIARLTGRERRGRSADAASHAGRQQQGAASRPASNCSRTANGRRPRLGAGMPVASTSRSRMAARAIRSTRERRRDFSAAMVHRRGRRAPATGSGSTADRLRPDPASRGISRTARTVRPRSSTRPRFTWTDADWKGLDPQRTGDLRDARRHVHARGHVGAAAARARRARRSRRHRHRDDADRGFRGPLRLGLRRRESLCADAALRHARRSARASSIARTQLGIGVILDVVYNHLGPDGNYLADFSPDYFTDRYTNDWGGAINFEGPAPRARIFVENAGYWIDEFHFDGLRLDATQDIKDASRRTCHRRDRAARPRGGRQPAHLSRRRERAAGHAAGRGPPTQGGYGLDALWNDDYHHTAVVALTGRREAYYTDYTGSAQELISCAKYGYLYQGQWYAWQKQRAGHAGARSAGRTRSSPTSRTTTRSPTPRSARACTSSRRPARYRALTALTLLGPATPMLFQGQEFASSAPFLYFADHREELRQAVRRGPARVPRRSSQTVADPEVARALPSPGRRSDVSEVQAGSD